MAYGLPRKNTVKTILRGGCFKVQEPWDLALLTKTWYMNLANIKLPFLEEITFGSPFYLQKNKTTKSALLPSAESIKLEREYEMKRLKNLKCQKILAEEVQFSLRESVVTAVMMGLLMFSLGCSVEFRKLWSHIRRPWGIAVGLLCQFGLMPLTAYLLAISFSLKPAQAVAVLVMGCCPGGTISNIFTFWVDGDMDLSITMTTCSTVAALGMMPLCLYLYTLSWNLEQNLTIPYQNIGITLVCLTIPVAFGIYVNYRWPKQSKIILKIGAIVGGVLLLVVAVAGVVLAKGSWNSDITLLTISFIFPLIGHVTGFLLALLTHQSWQRCRTISLETGAQNIQMCVTMLQLSFTAKQLVQMLSFPLAYGLFQLLDGFLIVAAYKMYKRRLKNEHRKKNTRCEEGCHNKKSTSSKETGAFLEVNEEVTITSGLSMPMDLHTTLEPTGHISSGT